MKTPVTIREEQPEDMPAIRNLAIKAFDQPQEADLIDAVRKNNGILLSLVAVVAGEVAGHALYSPVSAGPAGKEVVGSGLGPIAVLPGYQHQGIGAALIEFGNSAFGGSRLAATFFDRRFELYAGFYGGYAQFKSIRDPDGNVIIEAQDPVVTASGLVYRVELASGNEGFQTSIFFQYPWEL